MSRNAQPIQYGEVFEQFGNVYVAVDGGALLLSHAVERAIDLGRPCFVMLDGQSAFIKSSYGPNWWARASMTDIRRVAVR